MKNQFYLKNFKSKWIKYDNYDLREDSNGSTGFSHSAATSLIMYIASASSSSKCES